MRSHGKFMSLLSFVVAALCSPQRAVESITHIPPTSANPSLARKGDPTPAWNSVSPVPSNWKKLQMQKGEARVLNSCGYSIYIEPTPAGPTCPKPGPKTEVKPGHTWSEKAAQCDSGNTSIKIFRFEDGQKVGKVLQVEYGINTADKTMYYDISFIDCTRLTADNKNDLSDCPGYGRGMQLVSMDKCGSFWCDDKTPGGECCKNAYCDPSGTEAREAGHGEPNIGCGPDQGYTNVSELGLAFELCAAPS